MPDEQSAEQLARDMLERIGVEGAQSFSAGDLVELADLIAERDALRQRLREELGHVVIVSGDGLSGASGAGGYSRASIQGAGADPGLAGLWRRFVEPR